MQLAELPFRHGDDPHAGVREELVESRRVRLIAGQPVQALRDEHVVSVPLGILEESQIAGP
jgi:hypothetical protein